MLYFHFWQRHSASGPPRDEVSWSQIERDSSLTWVGCSLLALGGKFIDESCCNRLTSSPSASPHCFAQVWLTRHLRILVAFFFRPPAPCGLTYEPRNPWPSLPSAAASC